MHFLLLFRLDGLFL